MASKSKFLTYTEYILAKTIIVILRQLPWPLALIIGKGLGLASYWLLRNYRQICHRNLEIAFPNALSEKEIKIISQKTFINTIITFLELILTPKLTLRDVEKRTKCKGQAQVDDAFSRNKGIIVCSTHFSNWYWPALYALTQGYKVNVVIRPLDNELLNREMQSILEKKGIKVIPRKYAVKQSLKALKNNEAVALQIDQNAAVGGIFVPFFGVHASTMRGASVLKKMSESAILTTYDIRKGQCHDIFYNEMQNLPIEEKECLTKINHYFESIIEEHKELYFWLHPRWKKRPEGEKSLYPGLKV